MTIKTRNVVVIIMILGSVNILFSQWSVGIQGGFNSSKNNVKNRISGANVSYKTGFILGGIVNYRLNKMFSIQAEPRYNVKGEAIQNQLDSINNDHKIHLHFLELPLFVITEYPIEKFSPFLVTGFSIGYLVKANSESRIGFDERKIDIKEDFSEIDFAIEIGVGLKYLVKPSINLITSARYSNGLVDISDFDSVENNGSVKTRGLHLLVGVVYNL